MKVSIITVVWNNKDTIKLSFVNALRRIILSEIPVYVLDNIDFIEIVPKC